MTAELFVSSAGAKSASQPRRCVARTEAGRPCQSYPLHGEARCRVHDGEPAPPDAARQAVLAFLMQQRRRRMKSAPQPGSTQYATATRQIVRQVLAAPAFTERRPEKRRRPPRKDPS